LIEIERLVNQGNDLERTLREHGAEVKRDKLPISALVRCPLLALSWHLPDKKVGKKNLDIDIGAHGCTDTQTSA
jgi:hypothetical protein